jgi:4-carboxymuconolactone decarboxylase
MTTHEELGEGLRLNRKEQPMSAEEPKPPTRGQLADFAPKLSELTQQVLFGDVWERPGLSKRDRSLITVAALVALNRTEQLRFHLVRALENGVTKDEVVEAITHLAFYSGWPTAMSAIQLAKELYREK